MLCVFAFYYHAFVGMLPSTFALLLAFGIFYLLSRVARMLHKTVLMACTGLLSRSFRSLCHSAGVFAFKSACSLCFCAKPYREVESTFEGVHPPRESVRTWEQSPAMLTSIGYQLPSTGTVRSGTNLSMLLLCSTVANYRKSEKSVNSMEFDRTRADFVCGVVGSLSPGMSVVPGLATCLFATCDGAPFLD